MEGDLFYCRMQICMGANKGINEMLESVGQISIHGAAGAEKILCQLKQIWSLIDR